MNPGIPAVILSRRKKSKKMRKLVPCWAQAWGTQERLGTGKGQRGTAGNRMTSGVHTDPHVGVIRSMPANGLGRWGTSKTPKQGMEKIHFVSFSPLLRNAAHCVFLGGFCG